MTRGRRPNEPREDDAVARAVHVLVLWGYSQGGRTGACAAVANAMMAFNGRQIGESGVEKVYKTWLASGTGTERRIASRFTAVSRKRYRPRGAKVADLALNLLRHAGHADFNPMHGLEHTKTAAAEFESYLSHGLRVGERPRPVAHSRRCTICRFRVRTVGGKLAGLFEK
jgi:hypothetical protein